MRILYLHQYFNTPDMAGGTRSYEMARRLVNLGHDVYMITSDRTSGSGAERWRVEEVEGIHVHWLSVPYSNDMRYSRRLLAFFRFAFGAAGRAASLKADVVFASSTPLTIVLPAVFSARRQGIPMILEVRDLWPEIPIVVGALKDPISRFLAKRLERFAYRNSRRVVALSPGMKRGIVDRGYPADQVAVIPNASDIALFDVGPEPGQQIRARYDWLRERPLVIYMGALGTINGVDYLVRVAAAARRTDPDVRFAVIGTGREEDRIRRLAGKHGVLNINFFMLGTISKQETPAWLSAADIATSLVIDIPALWANSANKFFDTLAARKPVAINYGGWQADLLRQHSAGIVLDPRDAEAAAENLIEALRDASWLRHTGAAAGRLAEREFARDKLASELEAHIREVGRADVSSGARSGTP